MSTPRRRRIILGITGSTSATKSQSIALALQHVGFEVRVAISHSARQIVAAAALTSVVQDQPFTDIWSNPGGIGGEAHIIWSDWADAMVVAPATASCIGSLYLGTFDSPVTLIAGAMAPTRMFLAPAMAQEMWLWPSVQRNVAALKDWGVRFLGPVQGKVASGHIGMRLMEPRNIATELNSLCQFKERDTDVSTHG